MTDEVVETNVEAPKVSVLKRRKTIKPKPPINSNPFLDNFTLIDLIKLNRKDKEKLKNLKNSKKTKAGSFATVETDNLFNLTRRNVDNRSESKK